jgi:hypothetical protein
MVAVKAEPFTRSQKEYNILKGTTTGNKGTLVIHYRLSPGTLGYSLVCRKVTPLRLSFCPQITTPEPLDKFPLNLTLGISATATIWVLNHTTLRSPYIVSAQIFQKFESHFKLLDVRWMRKSKFRNEDPRLFIRHHGTKFNCSEFLLHYFTRRPACYSAHSWWA